MTHFSGIGTVGPSHPVLVVDDDIGIRNLIVDALQLAGYRAIGASNGAVALDLVQRESPAAIILDVRMPIMDGRAFLAAYHALLGPHAPVVVCSAHFGRRESFEQLGVAAFVDKPFDVDHLLETVRCSIGLSHEPKQAR
jgi:two-component system, response regulator, stage 0 sporulation protein F